MFLHNNGHFQNLIANFHSWFDNKFDHFTNKKQAILEHNWYFIYKKKKNCK